LRFVSHVLANFSVPFIFSLVGLYKAICFKMVSVKSKESVNGPIVGISTEYTVHTGALFDSKLKTFLKNVSITVDKSSGLVTKVFQRTGSVANIARSGDIDLSSLFVMPGFVDAHAHIFLHPYK